MHTRSQSRNLHNQQHQAPPPVVEQFNLEEPIENPDPLAPMDDNRTMAQLLEAPTAGYEDAIVVPEITADNFELKHDHFYDEVPERPEYVGKAYAFPIFPRGAARIWLEKEPPRSIQTWDDLVLKFINKFFPPSKTTNLRNEITRFQQRFDETFYEAWDRFNDLLRACPHHGFSELHQLDTFYNALNSNDQDSLNSAAGGNFLDKMPRDSKNHCKQSPMLFYLNMTYQARPINDSNLDSRWYRRRFPSYLKAMMRDEEHANPGETLLVNHCYKAGRRFYMGITTRSGVVTRDLQIHTTSLLKVVEVN
ncbi:reverse transcriptase domain-containing protein [Tanacetum coccineum]